MNKDDIAAAAEALVSARVSGRPIHALPASADPADETDAYAIQDAAVPLLQQTYGPGLDGYKIGCTNPTAQAQLGLDAPFLGYLFSAFTLPSGTDFPASELSMRQLEPEVAFRLKSELPASGAPYSAETVKPAIATAMPAIEIVDSRFTDWTKIGALRLIADNASSGRWVKGPEVTDIDCIDYSGSPTSLRLNGELIAEGSTANVLGNPLNALAWLANRLAEKGRSLRTGMLITTGTTTAVLPAAAGDEAVADFGALGTVSVRFV